MQPLFPLFFQISLSDVPGTGRDGRILKEDILFYIQEMKTAADGTLITIIYIKINYN